MTSLPSPPWGRGWRAAGVVISRGETGEGVNHRGHGGNHEYRASLSHHASSGSDWRTNPESARTSPPANGQRTSNGVRRFSNGIVQEATELFVQKILDAVWSLPQAFGKTLG